MDYETKKKHLVSNFLNNLSQNKEVKFTKKTSNLFRTQKIDKSASISVHDFNKVINIDAKNRTATVEAMIRFEDLVKETLKYKLLPPVVPQLKTITLGGAVSGVGIEASSFRYGLVHETVLEMEVLLSDGSIVVCTPDNEHKDLFFALPNSYGTLGYILKIKIPLVKAKKFVHLRYLKYTDSIKYFDDIKNYTSNSKYDFVDGVIFNERLMYIIIAKFSEDAPYTSNYKYMNVFYKSILKRKDDYLTTKDFIWRWDTDWFWCSKMFFMNNWLLRLILGPFMLGSKSYWKIARFEEKYKIAHRMNRLLGKNDKTEDVVQDVAIPIENCQKFLQFFNKNIGIKPIWICPTKNYNKKHQFPLFALKNKLYLDFGFWDTILSSKPDGYHNKLIEKEVEMLSGAKSLYSKAYYEKNKFWQLYDKKYYDKIKSQYDPNSNFKDIYQKCVLNK